MALINIEYGSLANSDILNKNFMHLDDKIAETADSIETSISSILSNIATINTRLNDITESITNSVENLTSILDDYKAKTKILVSKSSMLPNWGACKAISISGTKSYTATTNGYLLFKTAVMAVGNLIVNDTTVPLKTCASAYEANSVLSVYPLTVGDVVKSDVEYLNAYFLPVKEISIENF